MAAAAGLVLSAASTQAAPLGFALKAETPHFSFYARDNQKVDAARSEAYLHKVEQMLGARFEGHAEYFRYSTPEQLAARTGTYGAGVTLAAENQIHSTRGFHAHEIVHLVAAQLGNPGTFFQEGLAVALGNEAKWNGKPVDALAKDSARRVRLSQLLAAFETMDPQAAYPLAGSFVASLIKAHGMAKVVEFFRACNGRNTDAAFAQTFGESLDQAGESWARNL
jgi:hypothetical protein